jgi:lysozyme
MPMTRREFLGSAAAGAAVAETAAYALAQSSSWPKGIDVSHWQGTINWSSVRSAGTAFAFCKATETTSYKDPTFDTNWAGMKSAGLVRGAYHFGRPADDPVAQANWFIDTVRPGVGDLPPVLDLEDAGGKTPAQVWAWVQAFVAQVKARIRHAPIIYTGFFFWKDSVGYPTNNLGCPLWFARYDTTIPPQFFPSNTWSTWTFWQYSNTGSVSGISGNVDLDYHQGTIDSLKRVRLTKE